MHIQTRKFIQNASICSFCDVASYFERGPSASSLLEICNKHILILFVQTDQNFLRHNVAADVVMLMYIFDGIELLIMHIIVNSDCW